MVETLSNGLENLNSLLDEFEELTIDFNEADTRHRILDRLIHDCLGWERNKTKIENRFNNKYSDYELGEPAQILIEAKRSGQYFHIPNELKPFGIIRSIKSLCSLDQNFKDAFEQAHGYCASRGIQIGVVTNGRQIIIFLGVRNDGVPPSEGKCLLFDGFDEIRKHFARLWQTLSPYSLEQQKILNDLTLNIPTGVPPKLSTYITGYPSYRYPSDSQLNLRALSDLLIDDAPHAAENRYKFYQECYCESGALAQESLLGKNILSARYAAMFNPSKQSPALESVSKQKVKKFGLSEDVVAEALGKRPIVIMGDVGVGKTSFIRNLIYVTAKDEINNSIFIYIDLGVTATLGQDLQGFFLNEIESQLLSNENIDIYEDRFIRGVYHGDLQRFEKGIYGSLKERDYTKFLDKQLELLEKLTSNKAEHLQKSVQHLSKGRRKQLVLAIDNADQRSLEDQQRAFLAAQEFAENWSALVLIALRPKTYFTSKFSGSISAYSQRILTVSPPRIDKVLEKRLSFSLNLAEGNIPIEALQGITVKLDSIVLFIKALLFSLRHNKGIIELLSNITGGNIREVLQLIKGFRVIVKSGVWASSSFPV